jgi:hypothetical protein
MPADSIPAAHSALTETSARPVSKSSFKKEKTTRSHAYPKETSYWPCRGAIRLEPVTAMSVLGHSRPGRASSKSAMPPKAEVNSEH